MTPYSLIHSFTHSLNWWYPPILAYHRVTPEPRGDTPALDPASFARQMQILAERLTPIPLSSLVEHLEGRGDLPARPVVVTFDDGTEDLYRHAFPVMEKFRIPATIFLIVRNIGQSGSVTLAQIQAMQKGNLTFGSHTLSHDYLPSMPLVRAEESLSLSKQLLEEMGVPAPFLSYPAGGYTPEIARVAALLGYRAACTTNRGRRRFPIDRWALRRITLHRSGTSPWAMRLRCSGYYGLNRRLRPPC